MLWSFRKLDVTLGSLNHCARHLDVTLKPQIGTASYIGLGALTEFCKDRKRFAALAECAACGFRSASLFLSVYPIKSSHETVNDPVQELRG